MSLSVARIADGMADRTGQSVAVITSCAEQYLDLAMSVRTITVQGQKGKKNDTVLPEVRSDYGDKHRILRLSCLRISISTANDNNDIRYRLRRSETAAGIRCHPCLMDHPMGSRTYRIRNDHDREITGRLEEVSEGGMSRE